VCRSLTLLMCATTLWGCGEEGVDARPDAGEPAVEVVADAGTAVVEIGLPGGEDGLDFAPLDEGGELRLQTFGQGGYHVFLGLRTTGLGARAFVTVRLRNVSTGAEIEAPAPPRPQLFFCDDARWVCELVPITVMVGGLTEVTEERDGLPVEVTIEAHNEAGARATATKAVALSTRDL
jgi:hypothetical protein